MKTLLTKLNHKFTHPLSAKLFTIETRLSLRWYTDKSMRFLNETNIVFLFMVLKDAIEILDEKIATNTMSQTRIRNARKTMILASIFLAYSYIGPETGYPFTLFIEKNTDINEFWDYSIEISNKVSGKMLEFNTNFDQIFPKLLNELRN